MEIRYTHTTYNMESLGLVVDTAKRPHTTHKCKASSFKFQRLLHYSSDSFLYSRLENTSVCIQGDLISNYDSTLSSGFKCMATIPFSFTHSSIIQLPHLYCLT